jgi:hypothetical protein
MKIACSLTIGRLYRWKDGLRDGIFATVVDRLSRMLINLGICHGTPPDPGVSDSPTLLDFPERLERVEISRLAMQIHFARLEKTLHE